jgi:5-methylthioribose kinase
MSVSDIDTLLQRAGLMGSQEEGRVTPLTGGVSSDIWRVDIPGGRSVCVKRALAQLKVAADWQAPVSRNAYEWAWMQFAVEVVPQSVPTPLAHDEALGMFAMGFLDPVTHPVWKQQLLSGYVDVATAAAVGRVMGVLHQSSARRPDLAARFATDDNFHALRLEPYLVATAGRHPSLAPVLHELVQRTAHHPMALVHGDVSPKNILVGPNGPILLDAECAWYGDPAFDVAFCLNHLMLKRLVVPHQSAALHESFLALLEAYFDAVTFEPRHELEARCARLLPALMLARVDGKSPVEYLTTGAEQDRVRAFAVPRLVRPVSSLADISSAW